MNSAKTRPRQRLIMNEAPQQRIPLHLCRPKDNLNLNKIDWTDSRGEGYLSEPFDNFPITLGFQLGTANANKPRQSSFNIQSIQILSHEIFVSKYIEIFVGKGQTFETSNFQYVGLLRPKKPITSHNVNESTSAAPSTSPTSPISPIAARELHTLSSLNLQECQHLLLRVHKPHAHVENTFLQSGIVAISVTGTNVKIAEDLENKMQTRVEHLRQATSSNRNGHSPRFVRELDATLVHIEQKFKMDFPTKRPRQLKSNLSSSLSSTTSWNASQSPSSLSVASPVRTVQDLTLDIEIDGWTNHVLQLLQNAKRHYAKKENYEAASKLKDVDDLIQNNYASDLSNLFNLRIAALRKDVNEKVIEETEWNVLQLRLEVCEKVLRVESLKQYCTEVIEDGGRNVWNGVGCTNLEEVMEKIDVKIEQQKMEMEEMDEEKGEKDENGFEEEFAFEEGDHPLDGGGSKSFAFKEEEFDEIMPSLSITNTSRKSESENENEDFVEPASPSDHPMNNFVNQREHIEFSIEGDGSPQRLIHNAIENSHLSQIEGKV